MNRALTTAGASWEAWPEAAVNAPLDEHARLSALLLLLAAPPPPVARTGGHASDNLTQQVIEQLRRRRLPWTATTARLALQVVRLRGEFDNTRVERAARCRARSRIRWALTLHSSRSSDCVKRGSTTVPTGGSCLRCGCGLVGSWPPSLRPICWTCPWCGDGDGGQAAREAARARSADDIAPLVRRLGELGARSPSDAWLRGTANALESAAAKELLQDGLQLAANTRIVPREEEDASSGGRLLVPGNEDLVRAAVLATRLLSTEEWVPDVLGVLARGAATSGIPGVTSSLRLKVASAAVDTLAARGCRRTAPSWRTC